MKQKRFKFVYKYVERGLKLLLSFEVIYCVCFRWFHLFKKNHSWTEKKEKVHWVKAFRHYEWKFTKKWSPQLRNISKSDQQFTANEQIIMKRFVWREMGIGRRCEMRLPFVQFISSKQLNARIMQLDLCLAKPYCWHARCWLLPQNKNVPAVPICCIVENISI